MRVKKLLTLIGLGTLMAGITVSADSGIVANCAPGIYSNYHSDGSKWENNPVHDRRYRPNYYFKAVHWPDSAKWRHCT